MFWLYSSSTEDWEHFRADDAWFSVSGYAVSDNSFNYISMFWDTFHVVCLLNVTLWKLVKPLPFNDALKGVCSSVYLLSNFTGALRLVDCWIRSGIRRIMCSRAGLNRARIFWKQNALRGVKWSISQRRRSGAAAMAEHNTAVMETQRGDTAGRRKSTPENTLDRTGSTQLERKLLMLSISVLDNHALVL